MKFSEMPYTRVDFPAVIAQAQEIIQRASSAKSGEEQFEIHQEFNKLMDHVRTLYTIAHIRRDGDVTNEFYDGEKSYYDEKLPELNAVTNEYKKYFLPLHIVSIWKRKSDRLHLSPWNWR